jgi:hypothetical protein
MRATVLLIAVVLTTSVGVGCGATTTTVATSSSRPASSVPAATAQQPQPSTTAPPASGAEEANHEAVGTVPNETGLAVGVAEKDLERRHIPYKLVGATASGTAITNWTVCETNPAPRTHLESGTTLRLAVAPSCK